MKIKKYLAFAIISVIAIGLFTLSRISVMATNTEEERICDGVYINNIHLGGLTKEEATKTLNQYVQEIANKIVELTTDAGSKIVTLNDFGFMCEEYDYIDQALMVGKSGNLIKRYKDLKDIEYNSLVYELKFTIDENKIRQYVETISEEYNEPSKNSSISRVNGNFLITDHVMGRKLIVDESIEKVKTMIMDSFDNTQISIGLVTIEDIPQYTRETFEKVKNVLGKFTTTYTTSSNSRSANLSNGAKLIDGTVLLPGEVFSAYELLNPFTQENGYMVAGAYSQGMVIDSIGGGVCQVTSTLYNAVLFSELEIVERFPHSMTVAYVPLSRDAAIAGTYKDFKFKNNTQTPIYIEAFTVGKSITFNIYGEETRSSTRTLEFVTKEISSTAPSKDVVTQDPNLLEGTRKVTQSAHYGYKTECYKIVYENGVEIERIKINSSTYTPSPAYVTIGTKAKEVVDEDEEDVKDVKEIFNTDDGNKVDTTNPQKIDKETTTKDKQNSSDIQDNNDSENESNKNNQDIIEEFEGLGI